MIRVIQGYRLPSGDVIQPGVYGDDDPRLSDKAQYLLDNRFAEAFDGAAPTAAEVAQDSNPASLIHSVGASMIRVFHGYRMPSGDMIGAGVYDITDPALFERGQYLLDNRHAEVFVSAEAFEPEPVIVPDEKPVTPNLKRLKVDDLKDMAIVLGLEVPEGATKDVLIAMIEANGKEAAKE